MRTVIAHFYNEEYLLPWWLEHHKKYFDHGIIVDYASTDESADIIQSICPTWKVFQSKFDKFDSHHLEYEMMYFERQVQGWRISIPVSEFVVGDIIGLTTESIEPMRWATPGLRQQWIIPTIVFAEYDPSRELDRTKPLWEQCHTGVHYKDLATHDCWQARSMHNFNDIFYMAGRHFTHVNTDRAFIFKYANLLVGEPMIQRKLQIQTKVSAADRKAAVTHCAWDDRGLTRDNLHAHHRRLIGEPYDCTDIMNSVLQYI